MTDSHLDPEREGEETLGVAVEELLPDPGFGSELFDEPSEQTPPRENVGISEKTLFPADPIFFSGEETSPEEVNLSNEPVAPSSDAEEPEPYVDGSETLEGAGVLFDPIAFDPEEARDGLHGSDPSGGLFQVPESEADKMLSTAAFYAASELPTESGETEESDAANAAPPSESTVEKPKKKHKKQRPVRELSPEEIASRREDASRRVSGARVRFILAAALTLLLAIVEILPTFGLHATMPLGISRIPGSEALLDLQLLLLIALCAYRSVVLGFRSVFSGRLRYEGLVSVLLLLGCAYDIVLYAIGVREPVLCTLVLAVTLSATVWVETAESRVEEGILALLSESDGFSAALPENDGEQLRVARIERADGFDEHIGDHEENAHFRFLFLLGTLAVGVIGLIAAVVLEGKCNPIAAALAAALLALPSGALLARRIYLSAMQELLLSRRIALIGESAAYSAASHRVFSIDDTEAFDADDLKIKIINVFGDFRLDEAVRLVAGVYRPIGGALAEVLRRMCEEAGGPREVELVEIVKNGVVAHADGRTVAVGTRPFMIENSIVFPSDAEEESLLTGERLTVLYCAVDGCVVARMFVEYTLSCGFENLADQLARLGTSIELRTADPCLSPEYLLRLSSLPRGVLSLRRIGVSELLMEKCTRAESAFFTTDRPRSLVGAWLAFRRYFAARRHTEVLAALQLALGALLLGISVFCFRAPLLPVSLAALYQILAIAVAVLAARAFCRRLVADAPDADPDTEPKGTES